MSGRGAASDPDETAPRDVDVFADERRRDDRTAGVYAALDARGAGDMASEEADAAVAAGVRALAADPDGARRVEAMLDLRRAGSGRDPRCRAWMAKARVTIRRYPITASDREVVMARSQVRQSEALRKARERQRELDKEEDQRREASRLRVAGASAHVIVALERRADAAQALETATGEVGDALRALLAEDVDAERAAALLELDAAEVRRLTKATPASTATPPARSAGQVNRRRTGSADGGSGRAAPAASVTTLANRGGAEDAATTTAAGTTDAGRRAG